MYEILHKLYLSSFNDALHAATVSRRCFFQMNITKDLPMFQPNHMRIAIDDDQSSEAFLGFLQGLPEAMKTIDDQLQRGNEVVVHCKAGQQRSAAIVAAYLLYRDVVPSLNEAVRFIQSRKKDAFFWSVNFRPPLDVWVSSIKERRA